NADNGPNISENNADNDSNNSNNNNNNDKWSSTTNEFSNLDSNGNTISNASESSILDQVHPVETEFLAADGRQNLLTHIIGPTRLKVDFKSTAYGYIPLPTPLAPTSSIS